MGSQVIDLAAVRADTPGVPGQVFLDSAGSSLPPNPVLDEVIGHLRREAEVGGYEAHRERLDDLEAGYGVFAELLDCDPDDIAFTDSATRSWLALVDSVPLGAGDRVLIGEVEYGANAVALLRLAEQTGASIEVVESDETGQLSLEALDRMLDERVKLVSLVHVPTNGGVVNPVREVVDAAHRVGALVLLDACQSVGQLPVRVRETGVDLVSGAGRKWLRGPRGTGFLVARRSVADRLWPRLVDHSGADWAAPNSYELRADARVYQLWESSIADRLGLIRAARYTLDLGIDPIAAAVAERADTLRTGLADLPGVTVRDLGRQQCGIVTFTIDGIDSATVRDTLRAQRIMVTTSGLDSTRIDMTRRGLDTVIRAAPHYFVSPEELDTFLSAVAQVRP